MSLYNTAVKDFPQVLRNESASPKALYTFFERQVNFAKEKTEQDFYTIGFLCFVNALKYIIVLQ